MRMSWMSLMVATTYPTSPGPRRSTRAGAGGELAELRHRVLPAGAHEEDFLALFQAAVDHADVDDNAAVVVVVRVEDQPAGRVVAGALGGRQLVAQGGDELVDPLAGLRADVDRVLRGEAQDLLDLVGDLLRAGTGEVDLVDDRDDLEVLLEGRVGIGDGLGLHALSGVDDEDRPLAGLERLSDLVVEVDVAGRVDEVEHERHAGVVVHDGDGAGLDGDAALALEVPCRRASGRASPAR